MTSPAVAEPRAAAVWAALSTVYLVWGSTYLAIRVVVESVPPLLGMGVRFVLAAALLAAVVAVRSGPRSLLPTRRGLYAAAVVGGLLLLGGNGMVAVAEQNVPSGLAALLVATTPLWLAIFRAGAGDRPRALTVVGTVVGFAGIVVLARPASWADGVRLWGVLVVLLASLSWAVGSFLSARVGLPSNPFVATVWEMACGGLLLLLAGLVAGEAGDVDVRGVPLEGWLWLGYLVVVGSIAGYTAYVWLLGNAPLSLTATYAYVNPVVAVVLGALVLGEDVTVGIVVGGAVVVLGVALVVTGERTRRRGAEPAPDDAPADALPDRQAVA